MIFPLFRRNARQDTISSLYGTIVAQARLPCFYREYGVADTINGRFDLLVLHLATVLDRLESEPELRELGQGLFDRFCQDMDHNLREIGIGDLSVPKEMQRIGEAYYGRAQAYKAASASTDPTALTQAIARNVYAGASADKAAAARLAAYVRAALGGLAKQERSSLLDGRLQWPDPIALVLVEDKTGPSAS